MKTLRFSLSQPQPQPLAPQSEAGGHDEIRPVFAPQDLANS